MKKTLSIAVIGLGQRGMGLLRPILRMKDVNVVAVCDSYQDRIEQAQKLSKKLGRDLPRGYVDYKELVEKESIEAVIISCSLKCHTEISLYCMEKGIPVGCEVGGVHDINECWALVDTYTNFFCLFQIYVNPLCLNFLTGKMEMKFKAQVRTRL